MKGTFPLPVEAKHETIQLNYGLSANVTKCGRLCTVHLNGPVNQATSSWARLGYLPRPKEQVITPNCAYMNHYLVVNYDGQFLCSAALPNGYYVQGTFTYILSDDE